MELFIPDMYQKSIYTIDYDKLIDRGIKCILFDLDNTLVPTTMNKPNKKIKDLFSELQAKGFKIMIFSNSPKHRVKAFCDELNIEGISGARKPFKKKFEQLMYSNDLNQSEVVIVGDQMLTDIYGGNKVGITTIFVNPVGVKDFFLTKINRVIESIIIKKLGEKGLFYKGKYYD